MVELLRNIPGTSSVSLSFRMPKDHLAGLLSADLSESSEPRLGEGGSPFVLEGSHRTMIVVGDVDER